MRKIFSLIAAVLFAGSMMAESITITAESFKSSYGEGTFTLSEVEFAYTGAMYNGKGSPVSAAAKSFIQLRKSANGAGEIKNNDELSLKTITVATQNDKDFTLSAGTAKDALEAVAKPEASDGKYEFTDKDGKAAECDVKIYAFDVTGKKYFDLLNGAAASYIAYITIELGEGGVTPPEPACKWDEIAFLGNGSGVAAYTDRFKVCTGDPAPTAVVNIQSPDWAAEPGIYLNFPSADWGAISLAEDQYKIQGAGILLYVSAFLYDAETEVTIVCQEVTYTLTVKNVSPDEKPVAKKTCAEVYTLAKNDAVALNDVVVTYANGKNVWVKDATASMLVFLPAASDAFKAGDVLSGVAGVVDIYNGVYEVKPTADQVTAIVATPGEAPAAEVVAELATTDVNKYIVMQNVEFAEDAAFAEGTQSNITINGVAVRNQFKNGYSFTAGKKYNIYGVVTIYSSNPQVYFITAEEASGTAIDNTVVSEKAIKMFENGQLIIIKNGVKYNALGSVIE